MTYEAVHARPDGDSTVARLALTAAEYDYEGVVVRNHGDEPAAYDPGSVAETYGIDVVPGVEIRAEDPARASGFLGAHRDDQVVVAVHGGDPTINRFAVEQAAVDVLAHPMAGDGDVNHVLAREAAANGVHLELSFGAVCRATGDDRAGAITDLRKLVELIDDAGAPFVVSVDARSHHHLRAPREIEALGDVVGLDASRIERGLAAWGEIVERNRSRMDSDTVGPGVRRGRPQGKADRAGTETSDSPPGDTDPEGRS